MAAETDAATDVAAIAEITAVLRTYFDGLHHADTGGLAEAFHPTARYVTATSGELVNLSMAEYFPIVDARPAPVSLGHARRDRIIAIELAGPVTALARVECAIPSRTFIDLLTLVRVDGRWQIVAKVFHYETVIDETLEA